LATECELPHIGRFFPFTDAIGQGELDVAEQTPWKMSKHTLVGGDARKLLDLLGRLKSRAEQRMAAPVKIVAIQEVGRSREESPP
jgi:hypothetical protein